MNSKKEEIQKQAVGVIPPHQIAQIFSPPSQCVSDGKSTKQLSPYRYMAKDNAPKSTLLLYDINQ